MEEYFTPDLSTAGREATVSPSSKLIAIAGKNNKGTTVSDFNRVDPKEATPTAGGESPTTKIPADKYQEHVDTMQNEAVINEHFVKHKKKQKTEIKTNLDEADDHSEFEMIETFVEEEEWVERSDVNKISGASSTAETDGHSDVKEGDLQPKPTNRDKSWFDPEQNSKPDSYVNGKTRVHTSGKNLPSKTVMKPVSTVRANSTDTTHRSAAARHSQHLHLWVLHLWVLLAAVHFCTLQ